MTAEDIKLWMEVGTIIAVVASAIYNKLDNRRAHKVAETVRQKLEENQNDRKQQLNEIHALVNGDMTEQKRQMMEARLRIAKLTEEATDWVAFQSAKLAYEGQLAKQEYLNDQNKQKPTKNK